LLINRIPLASFTNNKALHDFYSVKGSLVVNRRGEVMAGLKPEDLLDSVKPLQLIPVPYNTDLNSVVVNSLITEEAKMASRMLPERNFVRSRIGNSVVLGFNSRAFRGSYLQGGEFRLKLDCFQNVTNTIIQERKGGCWIISMGVP
jgi:hypothetical protein